MQGQFPTQANYAYSPGSEGGAPSPSSTSKMATCDSLVCEGELLGA